MYTLPICAYFHSPPPSPQTHPALNPRPPNTPKAEKIVIVYSRRILYGLVYSLMTLHHPVRLILILGLFVLFLIALLVVIERGMLGFI